MLLEVIALINDHSAACRQCVYSGNVVSDSNNVQQYLLSVVASSFGGSFDEQQHVWYVCRFNNGIEAHQTPPARGESASRVLQHGVEQLRPDQHVAQHPFHQQQQRHENFAAQVLDGRTATSLVSAGSEISTAQHAMAVDDAATGADSCTVPTSNCPIAAMAPASAPATVQQHAAGPAPQAAVAAAMAGGGSDSGSSMQHAPAHGSHRALFCSCSVCQAAAEAWLQQQDNRINARNAAAASGARTPEDILPGTAPPPKQ